MEKGAEPGFMPHSDDKLFKYPTTTPLAIAVSVNAIEAAREMTEFDAYNERQSFAPADVRGCLHATTKLGLSPLMLAVKKTDGGEMIKLLLRRGANPCQLTNEHEAVPNTPLMLASWHNKPASVAQLCEAMKQRPWFADKPMGQGGAQQHKAAQAAHGGTWPAWEEQNMVDHQPANNTALTLSAARGYDEVVLALLNAGADPNRPTKSKGSTPTLLAARDGHLKVLKHLHAKGADLNIASRDGKTPLMNAVERGNIKIIKWLLQHGADMAAKSVEGKTAYFIASEQANSAVMRLLAQQTESSLQRFQANSAADSGSDGPMPGLVSDSGGDGDGKGRRRVAHICDGGSGSDSVPEAISDANSDLLCSTDGSASSSDEDGSVPELASANSSSEDASSDEERSYPQVPDNHRREVFTRSEQPPAAPRPARSSAASNQPKAKPKAQAKKKMDVPSLATESSDESSDDERSAKGAPTLSTVSGGSGLGSDEDVPSLASDESETSEAIPSLDDDSDLSGESDAEASRKTTTKKKKTKDVGPSCPNLADSDNSVSEDSDDDRRRKRRKGKSKTSSGTSTKKAKAKEEPAQAKDVPLPAEKVTRGAVMSLIQCSVGCNRLKAPRLVLEVIKVECGASPSDMPGDFCAGDVGPYVPRQLLSRSAPPTRAPCVCLTLTDGEWVVQVFLSQTCLLSAHIYPGLRVALEEYDTFGGDFKAVVVHQMSTLMSVTEGPLAVSTPCRQVVPSMWADEFEGIPLKPSANFAYTSGAMQAFASIRKKGVVGRTSIGKYKVTAGTHTEPLVVQYARTTVPFATAGKSDMCALLADSKARALVSLAEEAADAVLAGMVPPGSVVRLLKWEVNHGNRGERVCVLKLEVVRRFHRPLYNANSTWPDGWAVPQLVTPAEMLPDVKEAIKAEAQRKKEEARVKKKDKAAAPGARGNYEPELMVSDDAAAYARMRAVEQAEQSRPDQDEKTIAKEEDKKGKAKAEPVVEEKTEKKLNKKKLNKKEQEKLRQKELMEERRREREAKQKAKKEKKKRHVEYDEDDYDASDEDEDEAVPPPRSIKGVGPSGSRTQPPLAAATAPAIRVAARGGDLKPKIGKSLVDEMREAGLEEPERTATASRARQQRPSERSSSAERDGDGGLDSNVPEFVSSSLSVPDALHAGASDMSFPPLGSVMGGVTAPGAFQQGFAQTITPPAPTHVLLPTGAMPIQQPATAIVSQHVPPSTPGHPAGPSGSRAQAGVPVPSPAAAATPASGSGAGPSRAAPGPRPAPTPEPARAPAPAAKKTKKEKKKRNRIRMLFIDYECPICLGDFLEQDVGVVDVCGHAFCHKCIMDHQKYGMDEDSSIQIMQSCPTCMREYDVESGFSKWSAEAAKAMAARYKALKEEEEAAEKALLDARKAAEEATPKEAAKPKAKGKASAASKVAAAKQARRLPPGFQSQSATSVPEPPAPPAPREPEPEPEPAAPPGNDMMGFLFMSEMG